VGKLSSLDEDLGSVLSYSIIAGDPDGAFYVDPLTGTITLTTAAPASLGNNPQYLLYIACTDGALTDIATVTVAVSTVNRPPVLIGATFTVPEGSPVNTAVGPEPNATGQLEGEGEGRSACVGTRGGQSCW
jgi:hypothetical protein